MKGQLRRGGLVALATAVTLGSTVGVAAAGSGGGLGTGVHGASRRLKPGAWAVDGSVMAHPRLSIPALATLIVALAAAIALGPGAASAAAAKCPGADRPAARMATGKAERLTLCLLNKQRAKHGMKSLRAQKHQRKAAGRHNRLMVRRNCFSHQCPGEPDLVRRLEKAGYLPCGCSWSVGENIAWGSERNASPREIVKGWMRSQGHRQNILNPRYKHIGVAVHQGSPGGGHRNAATYTTDFGFKG